MAKYGVSIGSKKCLTQITMSKSEGVRTAVMGGKHGVPQEYCGTVGGQSTDFSMVDTEVKVSSSF